MIIGTVLADGAVLADGPSQLLPAREQMAFTLMVHVILVPFGVALPFITLVMNYLGLRRGDPVAMQLARRWSTVMAIQFAVGAVTGTVLSLEFGLLWPGLMGKWGDVFGIAFGIEALGLLPRGHPDRDLHLRLEADEPARPLPRRAAASRSWPWSARSGSCPSTRG